MSVLERALVFWSAGVVKCLRVFWSECGCSGLSAGVLEGVLFFWSECGCSRVGAGVRK